MPEEFAEQANDAVSFDWRWYFFIAVEVMLVHQECSRKPQIVVRGSEMLIKLCLAREELNDFYDI